MTRDTAQKSASHRASVAWISSEPLGERKNQLMAAALSTMLSTAGRNPLNQATTKMAATNGGLGT